ncbi:MAG: TIR domain-containing protein [Nitrospiria bacterium]
MKRSIFYSWQSDLDSSINRKFIEDALMRSLRSIRRNDSELMEPALDRDTAGISGSPQNPETVFAKITQADIFVADVSITNLESSFQPTPNPNVLIELGYAIARLGWNRILLVQNSAFGGTEQLPSDLRGRRLIRYHLNRDTADRMEVSRLLQVELEAGLKMALGDSADFPEQAELDVPLWWGKWSKEGRGVAHGGHLLVSAVGPAGFLFDLSVINGSYSGEISGYARLATVDLAFAKIKNVHSDRICEIAFRRSLNQGRRAIELEETGNYSGYRGMGSLFSGTFLRHYEALYDGGILDKFDLARLYNITGSFYDSLSHRFQGLREHKNCDSFAAKVTVGGVRGLDTIIEGIVMRGKNGELWVAFIDDTVVRYFTTECDFKQRLPATIEKWRERFKEKEVVFQSSADIISKQGSSYHNTFPHTH